MLLTMIKNDNENENDIIDEFNGAYRKHMLKICLVHKFKILLRNQFMDL